MAKSRRTKKSKLRARRRRNKKRRSTSLRRFKESAPLLLGIAMSQLNK